MFFRNYPNMITDSYIFNNLSICAEIDKELNSVVLKTNHAKYKSQSIIHQIYCRRLNIIFDCWKIYWYVISNIIFKLEKIWIYKCKNISSEIFKNVYYYDKGGNHESLLRVLKDHDNLIRMKTESILILLDIYI